MNKLIIKQFKLNQEPQSKILDMSQMLKPVLGTNGYLKGFELRTELAPLLFSQDEHNFVLLKRVIKTCIYLNRLIRDGMQEDHMI